MVACLIACLDWGWQRPPFSSTKMAQWTKASDVALVVLRAGDRLEVAR
jgi:hypothetical protein